MRPDRAEAPELFNAALEAFQRGDIERAVASLRAAFFENLYIAPTLIGEEFWPQEIWYRVPSAEPAAAADYVTRYGILWRDTDDSLLFLREIWNDPLVRRELQSFLSLSKSILSAADEAVRADAIRETGWFVDSRRIRSTQSEILTRLRGNFFHRPLGRPRLASICLASKDPSATVQFLRDLLSIEPVRTSRRARGLAEFELPDLRIVVHGQDRVGRGDPYGLGTPPETLGWGAVFVLRVLEFDRYYDNARSAGLEVLDAELATEGERFFLVKDPSGYLLEISE